MIKKEIKVLNGIEILKYKFVIPSFQRAYTWQKKESETFLNDLKNFAINKEYYLGPLYVTESNINSVVDGQQRLTTLFLLLNATRLINYDKFISLVGDTDMKNFISIDGGKPFFQQLYSLDKISDMNEKFKDESQKNLTKIQLFINQRIVYNFLKRNSEVLENISKILENVLFVIIKANDLQSSALIFENINHKGVRLNSVDLIKNSIFSRIKEKEGEDDFLSEKYNFWIEIERNIYANKFIKLEIFDSKIDTKLKSKRKVFESNINTLFHSYIIFKKGAAAKSKASYYNDYLKLLEENSSDEKYPLELLREIKEISKIAKEVFYPNTYVFGKDRGLIFKKSLVFLDAFKIKQHIPMFLAILNRVDKTNINKEQMDELYEIVQEIVLFHFVFSFISSERPSKIESSYKHIAKLIYDKKNISIISEKIKSLIKINCPSEELIYENLNNKIFTFGLNDDISKYLKELVESEESKDFILIENKKSLEFIFEILENSYMHSNEYKEISSIEHILNKDKISIDKESFENFKFFRMLPLERDINIKIGNKNLSDKIIHYKQSKYNLVQEFVTIYEKHPSEWQKKWDEFIVKKLIEVLNIRESNNV